MSNAETQAAPTRQPTVIKKYANRRLYNTGSSAYVTLEDLAEMVKNGEDFEVFDAKTGEDITRSVLTQIIFEQESKGGQALLPVNVLRQLIRFYGDSMQMLVPSYLEFTIDRLTTEQQKFRDQVASAISASPLGAPLAEPTRAMFAQMDEQARKNMAMFRQALNMFNPFAHATQANAPAAAAPERKAAPAEDAKDVELDELRKQLGALQKRLDTIAPEKD
jgi:polyhydroxyalkanoate synthesis repressor PhaR